MRRLLTKVAMLAAVASTIGCDQVTKHLATVHLMGAPRQSYLGDSLRLEYAQNTGGFLSLGANLPHWARTACSCLVHRFSWVAALSRRFDIGGQHDRSLVLHSSSEAVSRTWSAELHVGQ
jgi:lipoprotein signal peptidase